MVEHSTADREVPGSNPGVPSIFYFKTFRRLRSVQIQRSSHFVCLETREISRARLLVEPYVFQAPPWLNVFCFVLYRRAPGAKLCNIFRSIHTSIGGLVVEYSPATRVTRVRFPADAEVFFAPSSILNILMICLLQNVSKQIII